ncbi:hypothetical protein [Sphingomonas baiyangensis]|uniref:Uncharacterized protein n=1 Tax=Sphingomonas baiyangensis TaxID=2572576 RepID=A0A4V5PUE9_9SPHN|nr:hypothetical protein [Sphingomonas baiyangensis]TKD50018.1 hypothetical protein FBR43_04045 [Sphingomonas baiyangensis]
MSPFELVFAAFGLLLGLAISEVLGGFSRALKLKRGTRPVRIGWLTPLLGLLVMLDLTNFWLLAWDARDLIGADYLTLVAVLAIVGVYYLAATLIFPDTPEEWPDFDDWYDRQNRLVVGGLLAANVMSWIGLALLPEAPPALDATPAAVPVDPLLDLVYNVSGFSILALFVALLLVQRRRPNAVMLAALCVLLVVSAVVEGKV